VVKNNLTLFVLDSRINQRFIRRNMMDPDMDTDNFDSARWEARGQERGSGGGRSIAVWVFIAFCVFILLM
jgi:hypothetical protein